MSDSQFGTPPLDAAVVRQQVVRNRRSRLEFAGDAAHRERVTQQILKTRDGAAEQSAVAEYSLLVLGAGNCRDLDLGRLLQGFGVIRLADLDLEAVQTAAANWPAAAEQLQLHAPLDAAWPLLQELMAQQRSDAVVPLSERWPAFLRFLAAPHAPWDIPQTSTVVSVCLLTQLIESLAQLVPSQSPEFVPALQALRMGHLRRMLHQTQPGGRVLLITDVVSSDTVPELRTLSPEELPACLRTQLREGNCFAGCHPDRLRNDVQILAAATGLISRLRIHDPWLWQMGPRCAAVYALELSVRPAAAAEPAVTGNDHTSHGSHAGD